MNNAGLEQRRVLADNLVWESLEEALKLRVRRKGEVQVDMCTTRYRGVMTIADIKNGVDLMRGVRLHHDSDFMLGADGQDPVTGTTADTRVVWLAKGVDEGHLYDMGLPFGVSLAACVRGMPEVGVIGLDTKDLFSTHAGMDVVFRNDRSCAEPTTHKAEKTAISVQNLHWLHALPGRDSCPEQDIMEKLRSAFGEVYSLPSFVRQASLVFDGHLTGTAHAAVDIFSAAAVWLIGRKLGLACCRWDGEPLFPEALHAAATDYLEYSRRPARFDVMLCQPHHAGLLSNILAPYTGQVENLGRVERFEK